nr:expressed protein [Hymenolepis microstoma]
MLPSHWLFEKSEVKKSNTLYSQVVPVIWRLFGAPKSCSVSRANGADGLSFRKKQQSQKKDKSHHVTEKKKHTKDEAAKKSKEKELHERTTSNDKYSPYTENLQSANSQQHETKQSKGFDEAKARLAAEAELNKKPKTYLESIGGGTGGSKEIEQKLVKQKIQKGLKYH